MDYNAAKCFPCPNYALCDKGFQLFPRIGYYLITTNIDDINSGFNYSRLNDYQTKYNLNDNENKNLYIFSHYIFMKCERISFKKTACKSIIAI